MNNFLGRASLRLRRHLNDVEPHDTLVLISTALIVGVGTGLSAVFFIRLLELVARVVLQVELAIGSWIGVLSVMAGAGFLVGQIVSRWSPEAKGGGIPEVMEAIALHGGRIHPRVAPAKIIASALTIGAGGSAGREGPIVQVGAALGSLVGHFFHLSTERVRMLVACGAAGGIAAAFNAPIAGSIFALEVILERFSVRNFGAVVVSAVAAAIIGRVYLGDQPAFVVPGYRVNHLAEFLIYIVVGLLSGLVAVIFIRFFYWVSMRFEQWSLPLPLKTTVGMILTGLLGLLLLDRQILGSGLSVIGDIISGDVSVAVWLLLLLMAQKLVATSLTLGSGNSGGVFSPALFLGAMLGGAIGMAANNFWPEVALHPGAYAIVGMAAVFSGAARSPVTAVIIVFEMSNDYGLILPLMMATVLSTFLAEYLYPDSIYTGKLKMKGISLQRGRDEDIMQKISTAEAMKRQPYVVEQDLSLAKLGKLFEETNGHSFPVVDTDEHHLVGMVSINDYRRAVENNLTIDHLKVKDVATLADLLVAYDDEPLGNVLQRIAVRDLNKLPVVTRQEPDHIIGVIGRREIVRAYHIALSRRNEPDALPAFLSRWQPDKSTEFVEVDIPAESPAAGQSIADLSAHLPRDCVIVSIRRRETVLFVHGDTVIRPEDRVMAYLRCDDEDELRQCLVGRPSDARRP
jgi:CIC family chloride channel protein